MTMPDGSVDSGLLTAVPQQQGKVGGWGVINLDGTYEIKGLDDGEYTVHVNQFRRLSFMLEI